MFNRFIISVVFLSGCSDELLEGYIYEKNTISSYEDERIKTTGHVTWKEKFLVPDQYELCFMKSYDVCIQHTGTLISTCTTQNDYNCKKVSLEKFNKYEIGQFVRFLK